MVLCTENDTSIANGMILEWQCEYHYYYVRLCRLVLEAALIKLVERLILKTIDNQQW